MLPNLYVFNARPVDKSTQKGNSERADEFSLIPVDALEGRKEKNKNHTRQKKSSKSGHLDNASDDVEKELKLKRKNTSGELLEKEEVPVYKKDDAMLEKKLMKTSQDQQNNANDLAMGKDLKRKRKKTNEKLSKKDVGVHGDGSSMFEKKQKSKKSREELGGLEIIDNGETSFADLFAVDATETPKHGSGKKMVNNAVEDINLLGGLARMKRKTKKQGDDAAFHLSPAVEVGMGGPSTWGDE